MSRTLEQSGHQEVPVAGSADATSSTNSELVFAAATSLGSSVSIVGLPCFHLQKGSAEKRVENV